MRVEADVMKQYPSQNHRTAVHTAATKFPLLTRNALVHTGEQVSHTRVDGPPVTPEVDAELGGVDVALIRSEGRGFCEGGKASGPLAHLVMVAVVEQMRPLLLAAHENLECNGDPPTLYAYADNMYGSMHYKLAPLFFKLTNDVGRGHHHTFTDKHLFLQGNAGTRSLVQRRLARLDPTLAELIRRPDLQVGDPDCVIPLPTPPSLPGTPLTCVHPAAYVVGGRWVARGDGGAHSRR